jgi:type IX secretion system PorP/SprF family membrane protein
MKQPALLLTSLFWLLVTCTFAQDMTNFTQFFINPYSINPSYAGIEGRKALYLTYRRQWADIEGGPAIANLTFHAPTKIGLNLGFSATNDTRGVLNTTGAMLTFGYTVAIDHEKFIRFGLSAGGAWNGVNLEEIENTNDPALADLLDNNASLLGNVGLSVHLKSFHFGASLPSIFAPSYVSKDAFTVTEVQPFQSIIVHASNRFYFAGDKHVFEPYVVYRINDGLPSQYEAAAVLHLNHILWLGGSFKQDFGISAVGGIKMSNFFLIGGSYSLKNSGINELNSPTYEIQLSYLFGPKKKDSPVYSFVNTVKEKIKKPHRKSASELLAEKRKQEEQERKHQQEELAKKKKEEEARKQEAAALAKKAEEERKQREALAQQNQPTQPPEPEKPVEEPPRRHDGGPRLKTELLALDLPPSYDTAHHEEQSRISRLAEHATDPDEHHDEDITYHPNAERHEFVKRGGHEEELDVSDYVIVGVFKSDSNAEHFAQGLKKMGFGADFGHLTEKELWYVYIAQTNDINQARAERDKYRKMKIFRDAWLLTVHH